jgi:hypothetical protein
MSSLAGYRTQLRNGYAIQEFFPTCGHPAASRSRPDPVMMGPGPPVDRRSLIAPHVPEATKLAVASTLWSERPESPRVGFAFRLDCAVSKRCSERGVA